MLFFRSHILSMLDTEPVRPDERNWHMTLLTAALVFGAYAGLIAGDWANVSESLYIAPQAQLGQAVGASVSVEPNKYNIIASELAAKEEELEMREAALVESRGGFFGQNLALLYTTAIGALLMVLILFNFYLDHTRRVRNLEDPRAVRIRRAFTAPH